MRYHTDSEFRRAIEQEMNIVISHKAWVLIKDFLFMNGIHTPCDDKDIKEGVAKLRYFRGIVNE